MNLAVVGTRMHRRARELLVRLAGPVPGRYWLLLAVLLTVGYLFWHSYGKPWSGDALYYTAMAFRYSGHGIEESIRLTGEYFRDPNISRLHNGFDDPLLAALIYPRVVYPALSVPFMLIFGGAGIWAVPLLSAVFVVWGLMRLLTRLFSKEIALAMTVAFMLSLSFLEFGTGAYTEAPTLAFTVALLMVLPLKGQRFGRKEAIISALMIVLITFTRQSGPVLVSAIFGAWLWIAVFQRKLRGNPMNAPLAVVLPVGIACTLFLQWWAPYNVIGWYLRHHPEPSRLASVLHFPGVAWDLLVGDAGPFFEHDQFMLAIWCTALLSCLVLVRSERTGLLLGALAPSVILSTLNGLPSSLRYYVPMYPCLILAAAGLLHWLLSRNAGRRSAPVGGPSRSVAPSISSGTGVS